MDFIQRTRLFQRAAETRSFSAVAREFDTTQPTVSKQVAALERELGTPLFLRTTAGLRLTDAAIASTSARGTSSRRSPRCGPRSAAVPINPRDACACRARRRSVSAFLRRCCSTW